MNYIKRIDKKIIIDGSENNTTFYKYLKHLCIAHFKSIDDLKISIKNVLNIKSEPPLYISKEILFIYSGSLHSKDIILINYFNVEDILFLDYQTIIIFKDKSSLTTSISKFRITRMLKKAKIVLDYVAKNNI